MRPRPRAPGRALALVAALLAAALLAAACEHRGPAPHVPLPEAAPPAAAAPAAPAAPRPAPPPAPGAISGRIVFRGPVPPQTQYVPEAGTIEAHVPIVDPATRGLKGAVVSVDGLESPAPTGPPRVHTLDQVRFTFVPHVLAVRPGDTVRFVSSDDANHNVRSAEPRNAFNVVTVRGADLNRAFRPTAGGGPAELRCDIHGWMKAWVYVFEHPWFAVTDAEGRFRIEGVPPGERTLRVRHSDGGLEARVPVPVRPGEGAEAVVEVGGEGGPGAAR